MAILRLYFTNPLFKNLDPCHVVHPTNKAPSKAHPNVQLGRAVDLSEYRREYLASYSPSLKGHLEVEGTTRDWSFVVLQ